MRRKPTQMAAATASFKKNKSNLHIPEELTIDILSRLPVKSLIRFCSVSKPWLSLIHHNPAFLSLHHTRSTLNSKGGNLLVTSQPKFGHNDTFMDVFLDDGAFDAPVDTTKVVFSSIGLTGTMKIISNHGLLCIDAEAYHSYVICNPAMRQSIEIPKCGGGLENNVGPYFCRFLGFGVVPETNDYKLFSIHRRINVDEIIVSFWEQWKSIRVKEVQVYTKSTGLWREIDATALATNETRPFMLSTRYSQIQLNGVLYWVSSRMFVTSFSSANYLIMGFDIREEKFFKLAMPDFKGNGGGINEFGDCKLTELEGSLALITCNRDPEFYQAWTMEDEHGDQAWVKKFKIKPFIKSYPMVWDWKSWLVLSKSCTKTDCRRLLVQRLDGTLCSVVQEIKNLSVPNDAHYELNCHKYVESLIRV